MHEKFLNLIHNITQPSSRLTALAALICLANKATEDNPFLQQVKALNVSILVEDKYLTGIQVPEENIESFNNLFKSFSWTKPAKESITPLKPQGSFARLKKALHAQIERRKGTNVVILTKPRLKLSQNEKKAFRALWPELVTAYKEIESMPNKEPAAAAARPKKRKAEGPAAHNKQKAKGPAPQKRAKTHKQKEIKPPSPMPGKPADDRTVSPTAGTLGTTNQHNAGQHSAGKGDAHSIKPATKKVKPLFPCFVNTKGPFDTEDTNMSSSEKGEFHPPLPPCDAPLGHAYDMSLGSEKDIRAFIKSL